MEVQRNESYKTSEVSGIRGRRGNIPRDTNIVRVGLLGLIEGIDFQELN